MANNRFNKQVSPKGYKAGGRTGKMGGGMMMKRPMMKKGGKIPSVESTPKNMPHLKRARKKYKAIVQDQNRVKKKMGGSLKPVQPNQKGLSKLPTKVRNKMGYMKKGGVVSDAKKKQFKENKAGQKSFNKKAMKVAKTIGKIVIPGAAAADAGVKLARKFKGAK